ncbi:MAG: SDR family oxidoreductase, partial [Sphingomonadales bacterium]|nr:SDR family oxidoreductase [Sphingomonadales bacterium]
LFPAPSGGPDLQTLVSKQTRAADIPLGRVADPEEVANAVAYLATSAPPSMTGAVIDVNGASYVR